MMNFRLQNIFFLCIAALLITSCTTTRYGIANQGSQARYIAKPIYKDTTETALYISGQYFNNNGKGFNEQQEFSQFGDLMIHRSHSVKDWNYAYGILGYLGSYDVNAVYNLRGEKDFFGIGVMGEINYTIPFKHIEFRPVGFRLGIMREFGDYEEFKQLASELNYIEDVNPNNTPLNFGVSSEVIYKHDKFDLGFQLSFAYLFNEGNQPLKALKTFQTIHFTYGNWTLIGATSITSTRNLYYSTGLTYKFY